MMKSFLTYINEWKYKQGQKMSKDQDLVLVPKSNEELRQLLAAEYHRLGGGTENNPINLNHILVGNIETLGGTFFDSVFKYIDISMWDVRKLNNVAYMFYNSDLVSINMSNWNIDNFDWNKGTTQIFDRCDKLKTVDLQNMKETESNWNFIYGITTGYSKINFITPKWVEQYK